MSLPLFHTRALFCLVFAVPAWGCTTRVEQYSARGTARVILDTRAKRLRVSPRHETPIRVVLETGPAMVCETGAGSNKPCIAVEGRAGQERMDSAKREVSRAGSRTGLLLEDFGLLVKDFFEAHLKQRYGTVSVQIGRQRRGGQAVIVKPRLTLPGPEHRSRPVVVLEVTLPSGRSVTVQDDMMSNSVALYLAAGEAIDAPIGTTDGSLLPAIITSVDRAVLRAVVQIEQYREASGPSRTNVARSGPQRRRSVRAERQGTVTRLDAGGRSREQIRGKGAKKSQNGRPAG